MKLTAFPLVLALLPFVTLPVGCAEATPAQRPADYEPVAEVSSLMTGLGSSFSRIRELAGNPDEPLRLEKLATWSELAAELSNVNTLHGPDQGYRDMAAATRDIALELAHATRAETVDDGQLSSLVIQLDTSCSTCHDADY